MNKKSLILLFLSIAVLLLSACTSQPVVTAQARAGVQMYAFKTFAFKASAGIDANGNASISSTHMKAAISKEMSTRAYSYSDINPDLLVDFNAAVISRPKRSSAPIVSLGMFGSNGGVSLDVPVSGADANDEKLNRIYLELLDVRRSEVVWEGVYEGVMSERDLAEPSLSVYAGVSSIFSRFPIK